MNPRLKLWLAGSLGAVAALVVGYSIANEHLFIGMLLTAVIFWGLMEWISGPWPSAWILAGVLFGYIVGNRGFAQFMVSSDLPVLPAEGALAVILPLLLIRHAHQLTNLVQRDWLNLTLLLWVLLGVCRIPLDAQSYGLMALRDFAMVYYAAFFFIAQALAHHQPSALLLRRTLTASFLVLLVVAAIDKLAPNVLLGLTVRGIPLIYFKGDLLAALLAAGFFWFWTRWESSDRPGWHLPAVASLLLLGTTASPRAALVATGIVTGIWLAARRWRIALLQLAVVVIGLGITGIVVATGYRSLNDTTAYATYESVISVFDLAGTGTYTSQHESGDPGGNNRFRIVWWQAVADETLAEAPVFGLGFGHDLAARFLSDYGLLGAEDFTARSPHSMVMSVFGRMGLVGLVLWLGVTAAMGALTYRRFREGGPDALGLLSIAWVFWVSAAFGIVLEGPMGAVVFWTVLGLASGESSAAPEAAPADLHPGASADEVAASP